MSRSALDPEQRIRVWTWSRVPREDGSDSEGSAQKGSRRAERF